MRNIFTIVILLIVLSFSAKSNNCPIEDFDKVVAFCTEENEFGIAYPAGTGDESIAYFQEEDEYRRRIHKTGCLEYIYAPAWYIMQIDKEGSLLMEISHSEHEDVDFACFGPYEGDSKIDVLKKICSSAPSSFSTSVDFEKYRKNFFGKFQSKYQTDCHFLPEYQPVYDSILMIDGFLTQYTNRASWLFFQECFVRVKDEYFNFRDVKYGDIRFPQVVKYGDLKYGDLKFYLRSPDSTDADSSLIDKKMGDIAFGDNAFADVMYGVSDKRFYIIDRIYDDFYGSPDNYHYTNYHDTKYLEVDSSVEHSDEICDCVKSCMDSLEAILGRYEYLRIMDPRYYDQTSNCFRADLDPFPDGKIVDCGISRNAKEVCRLENAKHGEWYLILLSNYSKKAGDILFKKIGGEATTNCQIIVDPTVENVCEGEDIQFDVNNAPSDASFVWTGPNGFSSTLRSPVIHNATKEDEGTYAVQMKVGYMTSPVAELEVKVYEKYEVDTTVSIELGESFEFAGAVLSDRGVYDHTFTTVNGCDSIVHLTLKVGEMEVVTQANGPLCEGEQLVLSARQLPDKAKMQWTGPDGFSSQDSTVTIDKVTVKNGGDYQLEVVVGNLTVNLPPTHVDVYAQDKLELFELWTDSVYTINDQVIDHSGEYTINEKNVNGCDSIITLHVVDLENNGPLCEGETLVLSALGISDEVEPQWIGPHGFTANGSLVSIYDVSSKSAGDYHLKVSSGDDVLNFPPTHVDVYAADAIDLYEYWTDSVFTFNDLVVDHPGEYKVNLRNTNGCDSIVKLHVRVPVDSIRIVPEPYFTPNGDGVKERWHIAGVEDAPTSVKIYDRFGKIIRVYDVYTNEEGWDGKDANGNDMPSTDYWYVISNATIDKVYVGHVALIR